MKETLKQHNDKISELRKNAEQAFEALKAYEKAFNTWLQEVLGISDNKNVVHLSDILTKWDEKTNDKRQ